MEPLYGLVVFVLLGVLYILLRRKVSDRRWEKSFWIFLLLMGISWGFQSLQQWFPQVREWILEPAEEFSILELEEIHITVRSLVEACFVSLAFWFFLRFTRDAVSSYLRTRFSEVEGESARILFNNLGILILVILFLLELGITWKVMLPFAGALGIGLGFGLQTIFNNYISGFLLILSRNLKVGDVIEIEGNAGKAIGNQTDIIYGKVMNINILTTRIHTVDGLEIAVPNSAFISDKIINYTLSEELVRVHIPFGVAYSSDPLQVRDILVKVAREHPDVEVDPPPQVFFHEMADSALVFHLLVWVNIRKRWRTPSLRSDIYFQAWYRLREAGIQIPFPQRDVWFRNPLEVRWTSLSQPPEEGSERKSDGMD